MKKELIDLEFTKEVLNKIGPFEGHEIIISKEIVSPEDFRLVRGIEVDGQFLSDKLYTEEIIDKVAFEGKSVEDIILTSIKQKIEQEIKNQ